MTEKILTSQKKRKARRKLSMAQEMANSFFYANRGKWFSATDLYDKADYIAMNTLKSLVRLGDVKTRDRYHTEYSYNNMKHVTVDPALTIAIGA